MYFVKACDWAINTCPRAGCLARCASVSGSLISLEVLQCVVQSCVASRSGQLPECSEAACPSVCECTLDKRALPAIYCQFNAAYRTFAECSFTCGLLWSTARVQRSDVSLCVRSVPVLCSMLGVCGVLIHLWMTRDALLMLLYGAQCSPDAPVWSNVVRSCMEPCSRTEPCVCALV